MGFNSMLTRLNLYVLDVLQFLIIPASHPMVDSVVHLGNTLQYDLSDKLDIYLKSMAFIRQANSVLFRFKGCNPETKMKLFNAYCLSLYVCALWRLDAPVIQSLHVSFNNVIRRIWNLPHNCHTSIAHAVGLTNSIYNIIYSRFIKTTFYCIISPI